MWETGSKKEFQEREYVGKGSEEFQERECVGT